MWIPQNLLHLLRNLTKDQPQKTPEVIEKTATTLPDAGGLGTVELVFPLKSIPTVVAGLLNHIYPFMALKPFLSIDVNSLLVP